jgi:hypothetical protein
VTKPITRQVFQRGAANTGNIAIQGTYAGSPSRIEARAVVMAGTGNSGSDTAWITITPSPSGGTFSGSLGPVTAGGWYQIEVRSVTAGAPGITSTVQRVGVGDVYLTAGQSNSANYGSPAGVCADDRVSSYNYSNGVWAKAADPMPGATGEWGSVWTRLGDLLAARDNIPIAFACMGQGSSQVSDWVPGSGGSALITAAVQAFPVNGFRAFLWHQGESDAIENTTPAVYQSRLNSVISQSRVDAGWSVPWYISEASFHPYTNLTQEEPVVAGQRRVIEGDALVFPGPVTDDFHLTGGVGHDTPGWDVHFNAAGLADFAAQWVAILGGMPDLAPKNGDFESNAALTDGAAGSINTSDTLSPSVIAWRALAASGEAVADGDCGYYNPNNASYAGAADGGAVGGVLPHMSGRHVAYLSNSTAGAGFLQTRRAMLQASQIYTLTVALGVRGNGNTFGGATLEILANGTIIASRSVTRAELDTLNGGNAANTFTDIPLQASTGASVTAGQALAIRIRKTGGAGTYLDFDNVRLELGPNTPPAAPTGLTATPMDAAVALSWTASPGATGYKVSVTPGTVVTTTASPYTVTGLTNGTPYQFKVLGTNSVGDGAYSGVVSATPLAGVATTTTLAAMTPSTYGNPVTFTATVAPAPTSGGTVQFYDNTVALGSPVAVNPSTGVVQYTTSALTAGSHPITATFSGTTGFNGSTAGAMTQTVNPATPVVTVTGTTSFTYNASAQGPNTAATGGSTGAVTFSYAGVSGTTYPASGTPPTNAGSYTCTATVAADSNYLSASSGATPFAIAKTTPVITWNTPSPIIVGTALGATQLNATSGGVAGNFVYTPASGAVLALGSHTLSTQFTPTATANYNTPAATTVTILVRPVGSSNITAADSYPLTLYQGAGWGNPPADGISASDLMDVSKSGITLSSITNNTTPLWGGSNTALNDHSNYPTAGYAEGGGFTVTFDTSVNTAGYDISSIISYSGNQDSADRISQKYDVEYHTVGGGWTHLSGDPGATVDRLFTGSHAYNGVDIGGTMAVTISGLGLSGVDQLRFTTHKNSCAVGTGTYAGYGPWECSFTEIDVLGTATVAGGSNTYATWAAAQAPPVTGGPNGDSDHDGIANLVEYALALDPAAADGPPGSFNGSLLSFSKRADAVTNNDVTYAIQISTTLAANSWVEVGAYVENSAATISCALPTGVGGKVFARLVVTQTP